MPSDKSKSVGAGAISGAGAGAAFGPWGALIGGVLGAGGALLSAKDAPAAVPLMPVDLKQEQANAVSANLSNSPEIEQLISRSNRFAQGEATSLMEQAIPGYGKLQKRLTDLSGQLLTNPYDVPEDIQKNLERIAAERGISAGTRGEFNDFSLLRDFGVNALEYGSQRINQGSGITQLLANLAPRVNPVSPLSFYISPETAINAKTGQNSAQQGIFQGAENAKTAAGNFNSQSLWDSVAMGAGIGGGLAKPKGSAAGGAAPATVGDFGSTYGTSFAGAV